MAKDAYYFSHDSNARNDERVLSLRMKHGWAGYGLFWAIIEKMREGSEYQCVKDYNIIAFDLRVDAAVIKSIVEDFGLFVFTDDGKYFYSVRLKKNMLVVTEKSEKAKESALRRWDKTKSDTENNANRMRSHSDGNAIKVNESKVNESKGENSDLTHVDLKNSNLFRKPKIPLFDDVRLCFRQNGGTDEMAKKFFDKHEATEWFNGSTPIVNFRTIVPGFIDLWKKNDLNVNKQNLSQQKNMEKNYDTKY